MKQKRGEEIFIYHTIFTMLILIILLVSIVYFVSAKGSEKVKPEVFAKDLCLVTLTQHGTVTLQTNLSVEKQQNGFLVKRKSNEVGFFYPCTSKFEIQKNGELLIVDIK